MRRIGIVVLCLVSLVGLASLVYAATTISAAKLAVDSACQEVSNQATFYTRSSATISDVSTRLAAMPAAYAQLYADVAAGAKGDPASYFPTLNTLLAGLAAEFSALQPKVDAAKLCFTNLEKPGGPAKVKAALDAIQW